MTTIVGLGGSLRRASFNRALLRAAQQLQPETLAITIFDLEPLPLYNQDEDADSTAPAAVRLWRDALWSADALLIATPEYNSGVPGVLKNALDWASRPAQHQPLSELPIAIMGATPSMWGTARSQAQLRQTLSSRQSNLPQSSSRHPIHHTLPLAHSGLRQIIGGLHAQHCVGLYAKGLFKTDRHLGG